MAVINGERTQSYNIIFRNSIKVILLSIETNYIQLVIHVCHLPAVNEGATTHHYLNTCQLLVKCRANELADQLTKLTSLASTAGRDQP